MTPLIPRAAADRTKARQYPTGMLSRCSHFLTADTEASMSEASTSGEGQRARRVRGESVMSVPLGQIVLNINAKMSNDCGLSLGDTPGMARGPKGTAYKTAFIDRVRLARESMGFTQQYVADKLEIKQDKYSKYEFRSLMPHEHIETFCTVCGITETWLLTGKGRSPAIRQKTPAA